MISLENIFKNHFATGKISDDNLAKFAQDHLARLRAAQNHAFDDLMAETESVYLAYAGSVSGEDLRTVQRISATRSTDDLLQDFKAEVSRQEGLIRSLFGKDTPEYLLFFPQGATEYANASKANVQTLMDRMADLMQAYAQTISPDVVSRFVTLRNDYVASRNAQLEKVGEVSTRKTYTAENRRMLEVRLCANLHYIGYYYPAEADKCTAFFDQSIISYNTHKASDGIGRAVGMITAAGEPLTGASVTYKDAGVAVVHTKTDGTYRVRNVAIGLHTLIVSKPGYATAELQIDVIDDGDTPVDIELVKEG